MNTAAAVHSQPERARSQRESRANQRGSLANGGID
jgi:hypothetical protein